VPTLRNILYLITPIYLADIDFFGSEGDTLDDGRVVTDFGGSNGWGIYNPPPISHWKTILTPKMGKVRLFLTKIENIGIR
jgi:hypothetical protein